MRGDHAGRHRLPVFNEELIDLTVRGFQAINAPSFYPEPHDTADDRNR